MIIDYCPAFQALETNQTVKKRTAPEIAMPSTT
jgi:hypothetical protein